MRVLACRLNPRLELAFEIGSSSHDYARRRTPFRCSANVCGVLRRAAIITASQRTSGVRRSRGERRESVPAFDPAFMEGGHRAILLK
jgi:hypothetical protein